MVNYPFYHNESTEDGHAIHHHGGEQQSYATCRNSCSSMDDGSDNGGDRTAQLSGASTERPVRHLRDEQTLVPTFVVTDDTEEVWYLSSESDQESAFFSSSLPLAPTAIGSCGAVPMLSMTNHAPTESSHSNNDAAIVRGNASLYPPPSPNQLLTKKRKLSPDLATSDSHSLSGSDDQCSFITTATAVDNDDDDAEFTESILSALCPSRYAAIRRERRRQMRIPILPKFDLRRSYLQMFANVINSHDSDLLKSFLGTYCSSNVVLQRTCRENLKPIAPSSSSSSSSSCFVSDNMKHRWKFMKKPFDLLDLKEIFAFWAIKFDLFADHTCTFSAPKVITSRASEAVRIEGAFVVHNTDIYDLTPMTMHALFLKKVFEHAGKLSDPSYVSPYERMAPEDFSTARDRPKQIEEELALCANLPSHRHSTDAEIERFLRQVHVAPLVLAKHPREMRLEGRIVLSIAPNRRIEHIQLIPDNIIFTPVMRV